MEFFNPEVLLALVGFGVGVGLVSSFLGLGGGIIISPLLPLVIPITQKQTVATSLLTIVLVVSFNTYFFHRRKLVDWKTVLLMGPITASAALFAGLYIKNITDNEIRWILILIVIALGVKTFGGALKDRKKSPSELKGPAPSRFFLGIVSSLAGFLSATAGIRSGLIISPSLLQFRLVPSERVVPSANGIMIFTTFFGVVTHLIAGWGDGGGEIGPLFVTPALVISFVSILIVKSTQKYRHLLGDTNKKFILGGLLLFLGAKLVNDLVPFWN